MFSPRQTNCRAVRTSRLVRLNEGAEGWDERFDASKMDGDRPERRIGVARIDPGIVTFASGGAPRLGPRIAGGWCCQFPPHRQLILRIGHGVTSVAPEYVFPTEDACRSRP